jgi:hypothetical protein
MFQLHLQRDLEVVLLIGGHNLPIVVKLLHSMTQTLPFTFP